LPVKGGETGHTNDFPDKKAAARGSGKERKKELFPGGVGARPGGGLGREVRFVFKVFRGSSKGIVVDDIPFTCTGIGHVVGREFDIEGLAPQTTDSLLGRQKDSRREI